MQVELLDRRRWRTPVELANAIFEHLEIFHNRQRRHSSEEAIEAGWFGPRVLDRVRPRIGDVVAAAREPIGVFQRDLDPGQARLVGHHGSLTGPSAWCH